MISGRMDVLAVFENELRRRGIAFSIDKESGRHAVEVGDGRLLVSLENLQRDIHKDGDLSRVTSFIDSIIASSSISDAPLSADRIYWCLEPNDYEVAADFRAALSDRVDRLLVHLSADGRLVTWVTKGMLSSLGMSESEATAKAFANLGQVLSQVTLESRAIDDVQLCFVGTQFPFKASLVLAPNLREIIGSRFGWPLMAVIPDRNFLYFWAAKHTGFINRVGRVVVREYLQASYPISTEVYEITDEKIRAIGEFPTEGKP